MQALVCERTETATTEIRKIVPNKTRWTLEEANPTFTTSNKEAKVRQQQGEVIKMSFKAMKFRFLVDFSFVSRYFGQIWLKLNNFLYTVSQPLENQLARKPHQNLCG